MKIEIGLTSENQYALVTSNGERMQFTQEVLSKQEIYNLADRIESAYKSPERVKAISDAKKAEIDVQIAKLQAEKDAL